MPNRLYPYQVSMIMRILPQSNVDSAFRDLEETRAQAKAAGCLKRFETAWAYEKERAREIPGHALEPRRVLAVLLRIE